MFTLTVELIGNIIVAHAKNVVLARFLFFAEVLTLLFFIDEFIS